jgi:hypothetical protein
MTSNRKLLGAAAFSLALAGGGVAGALLGTPSTSSAQDGTGTTTQAPPDGGDHWGPGPRGRAGLSVAADALGVSEGDLRTALEDGKSIAQVADEQGVDVQTVIDALVADATTRLEEAIAKLPDRMTELVNHEGLPDHRGPGGPGGPMGDRGRGAGLAAAASAIGITPAELGTSLRDGSTIADVAAANNVEVQTVIDALVAEASARLDQAVTDGHLTDAEATARKADLEQHITDMVNGGRPDRPFGPPTANGA